MKREQWSSNLGFLLAAAGSAIGLGNLWKFPYIAGSNGGAVFLMLYLVLLILLGTPLLLAEMAVGRATRLNAIDACRAIHPRWGFVGAAGVVGAFVILSYYSVIGGWVLKYLFAYMQHSRLGDADAYYTGFVTRPLEPVLWHLLFAACCCGIVAFGVSKGIERISKIFLPVLLLTLIAIGGYALTLPGASQGLRFLFLPDFSQIHSFSDFASILVRAMGQVFFSLSIGMGTLITYGSYLDRKANLQKNAVLIPLFDLVIALLAGIAILPCVFSFGLEPSAGSGLLFRSLPYVFDHMEADGLPSAFSPWCFWQQSPLPFPCWKALQPFSSTIFTGTGLLPPGSPPWALPSSVWQTPCPWASGTALHSSACPCLI